jgi:uncharacterized integral membrane protein
MPEAVVRRDAGQLRHVPARKVQRNHRPSKDVVDQVRHSGMMRWGQARSRTMAQQPQQPQAQQSGSRLSGGAIASLTGLGVLLIFILQNTEDVKFDFLFLSFTWPLWLYTIVVAVFGALVWFGLGVMRRHRRRRARRAAGLD